MLRPRRCCAIPPPLFYAQRAPRNHDASFFVSMPLSLLPRRRDVCLRADELLPRVDAAAALPTPHALPYTAPAHEHDAKNLRHAIRAPRCDAMRQRHAAADAPRAATKATSRRAAAAPPPLPPPRRAYVDGSSDADAPQPLMVLILPARQ